MTFIHQDTVVNQILTSAIYNQTEQNILDHVHGVSGVSAALVRVLDRVTATATVTNTTTETDSYTFTVPGGTLGTNGLIYFRCVGDWLNNSGGSATATFRLYYGTTVIMAFSLTLVASASARPISVEGWIYGKGATNAQDVWGRCWYGGPNGIGGNAGAGDFHTGINAGLAIDSSVNQTFKLTAQHSVAAATITWSRRNCVLELHAVAA